MAKWNMFRGRLQNALLLLDAEAEDIKSGLAIVEAETQGVVKASVLEAFLREERADLPAEYLPLLCGMRSLGVDPSDYGERRAPADEVPEPTERQTVARSAIKARDDRRVKLLNETAGPRYILLDCHDPEAMQDAFRDRLKRAKWKHEDVGTRFFAGQMTSSGICHDLKGFLYSLNSLGNGPHFTRRFQERFWDICTALNAEIQAREGEHSAQQTTEQFIDELFREGKVQSREYEMKKLKLLNEHYHTHIADDVSAPTEKQGPDRSVRNSRDEERMQPHSTRHAKPGYISLDCNDPEALRAGLTDRMGRAGWTQQEVNTRFFQGKLLTSGYCRDISNFLHVSDSGGPRFTNRFQERFWDICAALNTDIQAREGDAPRQTTEDFVRDLFREGAVQNLEATMNQLKTINERYHRYISENAPPRG